MFSLAWAFCAELAEQDVIISRTGTASALLLCDVRRLEGMSNPLTRYRFSSRHLKTLQAAFISTMMPGITIRFCTLNVPHPLRNKYYVFISSLGAVVLRLSRPPAASFPGTLSFILLYLARLFARFRRSTKQTFRFRCHCFQNACDGHCAQQNRGRLEVFRYSPRTLRVSHFRHPWVCLT